MITTLNSDNFDLETQKHGFAVVKVFSQTCGPCKRIEGDYRAIAEEPDYRYARFYEVDVRGDIPDLKQRFGIATVPSVLIFHFGELIDVITGSEIIVSTLRNALDANKPDFERISAEDFGVDSL